MGDILNNLSNAELTAIRERALSKREQRACVWCSKTLSMRKDQHFCCTACRSAFSRASAEIAREELIRERSRWMQEREELLREIADLRRRVD